MRLAFPFSSFLLIGLVTIFSNCGIVTERKIFFLNSYHPGYAPSDSVEAGMRRSLPSHIKQEGFYLDAKRLSGTALDARVSEALMAIQRFRPDVIIASDDDAVKRVIVPSFKRGSTPVVFCGVNWSAADYGLPAANVTGMLEVLPLEAIIRTLQNDFPLSRELVVLSENSTSEHKNTLVLDTVFRRLGLRPYYKLVNDFEEWKAAFAEANQTADLIYLPTNGAIRNWQPEAATAFVRRHIRKPVFTCDDFMMSYAVVGFTKVAAEQGEWAASRALEILDGRSPSAIPVTTNKKQIAWWNPDLANRIGWTPNRDLAQQIRVTP